MKIPGITPTSPALWISASALVIALGGTSYAAFSLPTNSVGTKQLKKNAVTAVKIKNGAVTGAKLNLSGVVVPLAANARSATAAGSANTATTAVSATNAANASMLGGVAAAGYEPRIEWAYVSGDGVIRAQSGGIQLLSGPTNGFTFLTFPSSVLGHAISVTPHYDFGGSTNGAAEVAPCGPAANPDGAIPCALGPNTGNEVQVQVQINNGTGVDEGFYVAVMP